MRYGKEGGLVYSTEHGQMCPGCRQPQAACRCGTQTVPAGDGVVRVSCQRKGRAGKTVTLVRGVPLAADALATLGKQLRSACGSGGTVKDGDIEIQGDHVDTVLARLAALGYTVKRSGG